jgi:CTP:phosphocholine cytidylyltransferase-like protein
MNAAGRMRKAIVMAGGQGERLRPLTSRRPKPTVPGGGHPRPVGRLRQGRDPGRRMPGRA